MFRIIARNILANWTGFAVQACVTFFLTPFVLSSLGDVRYGIWAIIMGLTGYYGLLDLGFRSALTQYLTRFLATKDYERLNQTASTGFVMCSLAGFLVLMVSVACSVFAPGIFRVPDELVFEIRWAILIVGIGAAFQFPFFVFAAVFPATQRYDYANAIGIFTRLLQAFGIVFALRLQWGLIGVSAAVFLANVVDYALKWVVARRILPELTVSLKLADRGSLKTFMTFAMGTTLISSGNRLLQYSDIIIIGIFLPVAAVTPYALAASLVAYFNQTLGPAAMVFFPAATQLHARNDTARLKVLYLRGALFLFTIAVIGAVIGMVWANDFFALWIDVNSLPADFPAPAYLFSLLCLTPLLGAGKKIGSQILLGSGQLTPLVVLVVGETIVNIVVSIFLLQYYGLVGIVFGTIVSVVAFHAVLSPLVVCRHLGITLPVYLQRVVLPPVLVASLFAPFCMLIEYLMPDRTWGYLIAAGILAYIFAVPMVTFAVFTRAEIGSFWAMSMRRLGGWRKKVARA